MRLRFLGLLGWLLFCFVFLVFIKLLMARSLERFFFSWDAPWWMFIDCLIGASLIYLVKSKFNLLSENSTLVNRDFLILVFSIPFITLITVFWGVVGVEKIIFGKSHTYYDWVMTYLIHFVIQTVVCFSCISYFYVLALTKTKDRLSEARRAQSETELKLLQQQVDPHFLFNNLNVLAMLVEKDPLVATKFLNKFSELYRYILQTKDVEVVTLRDELVFSRNYLYLLKQRFGNAYDFDWNVPNDKVNGQMIVPAALQSLLENVVKHNAGNHKQPLRTRVELTNEYLIVENELQAKSLDRPTSKIGLENLSARYAFLTDTPVEISRGEKNFRVKLPLLEMKK